MKAPTLTHLSQASQSKATQENDLQDISTFVTINPSFLLPGPRSFIVDLFLCSPKNESKAQLFLAAHHKLPHEQLQQLAGLTAIGFQVQVRQQDLYRLTLELGLQDHELKESVSHLKAISHQKELKDYFEFAHSLLSAQNSHSSNESKGESKGESKSGTTYQQVSIGHHFKQAFEHQRFDLLLKRVQEELWCLPPNQSQYISNVRALAELLNQDCRSTRVAALSYLFAKEEGGIKDILPLADIFTAGLLRDIGLLFMQHQWIMELVPTIKRGSEKEYWQHAILSSFYLSKTGIQLSPGALQIISEHHESLLGTGKPQSLTTHQQHPLSRYIQVVDGVLKYVDIIQDKQIKGGKEAESIKNILSKLLEGKIPEQLGNQDKEWVLRFVRFAMSDHH